MIANLKLALIADNLTRECLARECRVMSVMPWNYAAVFKFWKPDILFVESAWQGWRNTWKYKIAEYPDYPKRNNLALQKVVSYAKDRGIPTIFWNKEDSVHFDRFIKSAALFDYIFTVDENAIPHYQAIIGPSIPVNTLMFAVQPALHSFSGFNFKFNRANFAGSYSRHIHERRRMWQYMLLETASSEMGLTVFNRNSGRKWSTYRYPDLSGMEIKPVVSYKKTAAIYKDYCVSLNVNTIEDSATMFSRRLIEILACGGIAVTSPAKSVDAMFKDYCHIVNSAEKARELFNRLKYGPSPDDMERARAGAEYVLREHTWSNRLKQICEAVGLNIYETKRNAPLYAH